MKVEWVKCNEVSIQASQKRTLFINYSLAQDTIFIVKLFINKSKAK